MSSCQQKESLSWKWDLKITRTRLIIEPANNEVMIHANYFHVFNVSGWMLSFETGLQSYLEVRGTHIGPFKDSLFHAYSTLCSVAYTRELSDSTPFVYDDIIKTSVAFSWRRCISGLCGFHYGAMVSISHSFSRGVGTETGFNPGWTLTCTFWICLHRLASWGRVCLYTCTQNVHLVMTTNALDEFKVTFSLKDNSKT